MRTIVLALNELNFDLVEKYIDKGANLPNFRELLGSFTQIETFGESDYKNNEPWIQWVSIHTGLTLEDHQIFRLGDFPTKGENIPQIFETLENLGLRVGALSPMNAENRLRNPAYFLPDPWTKTKPAAGSFMCQLHAMIRQTVNENSSRKISLKSATTILMALLKTADRKASPRLFFLAFKAFRHSWYRALFFDYLLHRIHMHLIDLEMPDFTFLFLNSGAHIQHHYLLESPLVELRAELAGKILRSAKGCDPIINMLSIYDWILGDYLRMARGGAKLVVATGLSQKPYNRVKRYYRLKDHAAFIKNLGIPSESVSPKMSRDFEIHFRSGIEAEYAAGILRSARMEKDGEKLFNEIEVRGAGIFATLTYPNEILSTDRVVHCHGTVEKFGSMVNFITLKNAMHCSRGYAFFPPHSLKERVQHPLHVAGLYSRIIELATSNIRGQNLKTARQ